MNLIYQQRITTLTDEYWLKNEKKKIDKKVFIYISNSFDLVLLVLYTNAKSWNNIYSSKKCVACLFCYCYINSLTININGIGNAICKI